MHICFFGGNDREKLKWIYEHKSKVTPLPKRHVMKAELR